MTASPGHARHDKTTVSNALNANGNGTTAHHAARLLAAHPEWDWRIQDLADLVHLSASQLGRTFNRHFGISPMQYLTRVRAYRLAQLLRETDLPIGVAMRHVGWRSRGHASRQFTAIIGVTPSAYRREAGGQAPRDMPVALLAAPGDPRTVGYSRHNAPPRPDQ